MNRSNYHRNLIVTCPSTKKKMSHFFLFSAPLIGYEFLKFDPRKKKKKRPCFRKSAVSQNLKGKFSKVCQNPQNCCRDKKTFLVKCCCSLFTLWFPANAIIHTQIYLLVQLESKKQFLVFIALPKVLENQRHFEKDAQGAWEPAFVGWNWVIPFSHRWMTIAM